MTRWLVVHPSDELYGADRVLLEVVEALGRSAISKCWLPADLAYPDRLLTAALIERGIAVLRSDYPVARRSYLNARGVAALARRSAMSVRTARSESRRVDAVYLNTSAVLPMAPLLRRGGRRIVCHIHEHWGPAEQRAFGPLLRLCDTTIAVSQSVADRLPGRPVVVRNGFADLPVPIGLPPADGPMRFLLASRWSTWKGHREFLAAWSHAHLDNAKLMIVGAPPPVGPGVDVPAVVRELGLTQTVTIIPERSDITDLIEGAHVVVVPSVRADPLPTIAIEAARAGRAVMASNCGGLPEIVSDGLTGWLVQPGDMGDWARALKGVDRTEARVRGAAARAGFVERFGRERFGAELRRVASSSLVLEQAIPNATTPQPDAPRGENRRYRQ